MTGKNLGTPVVAYSSPYPGVLFKRMKIALFFLILKGILAFIEKNQIVQKIIKKKIKVT